MAKSPKTPTHNVSVTTIDHGASIATNAAADPGYESRTYSEMSQRWHLPETLMGGTTAMRAAGARYLPQDDKESDGAWAARLHRSFLFNAFRKTVRGMTGKVFSKPILLKEDVPQAIAEMCEDVDREGRKLNLFAEEVFQTAMEYGLSHILVDMPESTVPNPTLADDIREKRRPYLVHIKPRALIGFRSRKVGSQQVLTAIRIKEVTMEEDGAYGEREVIRVREITQTSWTLWVQDPKDGSWALEKEGPMTLGLIPLVTVYTNRTGFMLAEPPLEDLAWMNVAHWQSSSDQRNILHVARVPILFSSGLGEDADKLIIGPNRHIKGPENSKMGYVEHTGAAIDSGRNDLLDLQDYMRLMGLELLMPLNGGGQTATAKSLDYADANSPLQSMAMSLQDKLDLALHYAALWMKLPSGGHTKVNTDFGITLRDAADVQGLIQARMGGLISSETFWAELKRRNILSEDFDPAAETILLDEETKADLERALTTMRAKTTPPETAPGGVPNIGSDVSGEDA